MTSTNLAHVEQVHTAAHVHGLDPALVCAVVEQESGWDTWADRYEDLFYQHYIQPLLNNGTVRTMTEAKDRSTSFGLMQVMGQTAREHGFKGRWLTQLCDPAIGLDIGCAVLRGKIDRAGGDTHAGLLSYNGGRDPSYPDEVLARVNKYREDVQP